MRARSAVHLCFRALEAVRLAGQLLSSSTLLDHLESTTALPLHPTSITCHLSTPQRLQNIDMSAKDYYGGQGGGTYLCLQLAEVGVYLGPGTSYRGTAHRLGEGSAKKQRTTSRRILARYPLSVGDRSTDTHLGDTCIRFILMMDVCGCVGGCCSCCSHV